MIATEKIILAYAAELKSRAEKGQIVAGTVHNCIESVRFIRNGWYIFKLEEDIKDPSKG